MSLIPGRPRSPYLQPQRLADVIAALQVMAADTRPENTIARWSEVLSGVPDDPHVRRWTDVFEQHGEFFLVYALEGDTTPKAALRLRYVNRNYHPKTGTTYTGEEREKLPTDLRHALTTKPLPPEHVATLTSTAIELHAAAISELADRRWWIPLLTGVLAFVAALAGVYIGQRKADSPATPPIKVQLVRPKIS